MNSAATQDAAFDQPIHGGSLALRACALGVVATGVGLGAILLSGLLGSDLPGFVALGWVVAVATGSCGITALAHMATLQRGHERVAQHYFAALAGNLLLQFLGVFVGMLAMYLMAKKLPALAAFGLSFAATVTVLQLGGSVLISRALRSRAQRRAPGGRVEQSGSGTASPGGTVDATGTANPVREARDSTLS